MLPRRDKTDAAFCLAIAFVSAHVLQTVTRFGNQTLFQVPRDGHVILGQVLLEIQKGFGVRKTGTRLLGW